MDEQSIILAQQEAEQRAKEEEEKYLNETQFDNEAIKFLNELSKNESLVEFVDFIKSTQWTDRQRTAIIHHLKITLPRSLSTTYLTSLIDQEKLYDDKRLIDISLTLDLTTYDLDADWDRYKTMHELHFKLEARKSKGGKFLNQIGKQTHRIERDSTETQKQGFKEKIKGWI